jgi:hypothetical protein
MKAQIIAGLVLAGATSSLYAEDLLPAKALTSEAVKTEVNSGTVPADVQFKTFGAGNQMLIDISEQVGNDLDEKLVREVGGEITVRVVPRNLLVSGN